MKYLMLIVSISLTTFCFSQSKKTPDVFEEVYVITLKGDTLHGHLKMPKLNKNEIYTKINFRDKTNKVKMYQPEKIKGYSMGGYFYQSAYHSNAPCFFKVLSKGIATLYQIDFELNEEGEKHQISEFCVSRQGKKEEEFIILEEKGLKKQLKDVFKSNKELVQKINEQKEISFNAETLEPLFKEFNSSSN